ncbi:hypothetical protein Q7P37_001815 [Cladosporium fusiforme]
MSDAHVLDAPMSDRQDGELWKDLFDEDAEMQSLDQSLQSSDQRKSSSLTPNSSSTTTEQNSGKEDSWTVEFMNMHPALMVTRNFLQLITRYTNKEIAAWYLRDNKELFIDCNDVCEFTSKVLVILGEKVVGGRQTLNAALDITRKHHRDQQTVLFALGSHEASGIPALAQNSFERTEGSLILSGGFDALTPLSTLLRELLLDPLFPFRTLEEIPHALFLELCISHSYVHVIEMLKVNNPEVRLTQKDLSAHTEKLLDEKRKRPPVKTRRLEQNSVAKCAACIRNEKVCADGSPDSKCTFCLSHKGHYYCSLATEHPDSHRHRQSQEGHAYEQRLENQRNRDRAIRDLVPQLYILLGVCAPVESYKTASSALCLPPPPKKDEDELHALVDLLRNPKIASPTQINQPVTLSSAPCKDTIEDDSDDESLNACINRVCELDDRLNARELAEGTGSPMRLDDLSAFNEDAQEDDSDDESLNACIDRVCELDDRLNARELAKGAVELQYEYKTIYHPINNMQSDATDNPPSPPNDGAGQASDTTKRFDKTGWGSDDMSPGSRLHRYHVVDDQDRMQVEEEGGSNSAPQQNSTTTITSPTAESDDAIFRGPLGNIMNDVLFDLAMRYTNAQILAKIKEYHPEASYRSQDVAWRVANAVKNKAKKTNTSYAELRSQLDAAKAANNVGSRG